MSLGQKRLPALSVDVWENIAAYTLTSSSYFLGPWPAYSLCSLLLLSRQTNDALRYEHNTRLYARLFRFKFDSGALSRRFSSLWRESRCLAVELKKRILTLKRIRKREVIDAEDLWTCYLMMLENDGRNERQLAVWARLFQYLHKSAIIRLIDASWFTGVEITSLTLWLWWLLVHQGVLTRESAGARDALMKQLLGRLILIGCKYPSIHGPDSYYHLPVCEDVCTPIASCSGPCPERKRVQHFSKDLVVSVPPITPVAMLLWTTRVQILEDQNPPSAQELAELPSNRAIADAVGWIGPTQTDIMDFRSVKIPAPEPCPLQLDPCFADDFWNEDDDIDDEADECIPPDAVLRGSMRHDTEWYRLVGCTHPSAGPSPLRGIVYRLGSIAGSWAGRFVQTDYQSYIDILVDNRPQDQATNLPLIAKPLYWELQEHHCLYPNEPIDTGVDLFDGDDFLNAWLPQECVFSHITDAIEIYNPATDKTSRYETVQLPRNMAASNNSDMTRSGGMYTASICEKLEQSGMRGSWEEIAEDDGDGESTSDLVRSGPAGVAANLSDQGSLVSEADRLADEEASYVEMSSHRQSCVADILVTGRTGRQGDAWGHFDIVGRIRSWDGLVVLLRTPSDAEDRELGTWVFRGYVQGTTFTGRWRETATSADVAGFEGGFVVERTAM